MKTKKPLNESRGTYTPSPNAKPPPPSYPPTTQEEREAWDKYFVTSVMIEAVKELVISEEPDCVFGTGYSFGFAAIPDLDKATNQANQMLGQRRLVLGKY